MGKALYRTYRSKSFDEVVGQEHITSTLAKAVKNGRVSHAYLFTGPRGVGKTSVARILAHAVNGLRYSGEETHLDIIEIDAASNRRIDEIRELRDKVHTAPAAAKYKVYIIDEVHMLTKEAFNALLKTLEEPPAHTLFILATTEAHKLPETIISRTQRFNFHAIDPQLVAEHLAAIAKQEKINIDAEALKLLAEYGDGSFRDSISLLDQLAATNSKITGQSVRRHLALPPAAAITQLLDAVKANDAAVVLDVLQTLKVQGTDAATLAKFLAADLRRQLLSGNVSAKSLKLLRDLLEVPASQLPDEALEIALLEMLEISSDHGAKETAAPASQVKIVAPKIKTGKTPKLHQTVADSSQILQSWDEILAAVRQQSNSLYAALKLAVPKIHDDHLSLYFEFEFYKTKVAQARNTAVIAAVIEDLTKTKVSIKCQVDKTVVLPSQPPDYYQPEDTVILAPHIQNINNIFGSAEMLES